jgi:hypothetical protein
MPQRKRDPINAETGEQVLARPHDTGSQANETTDGLDATTESLGTPPKIRLPVPRRMISKKSQCSTGQGKRRKFEGEFHAN